MVVRAGLVRYLVFGCLFACLSLVHCAGQECYFDTACAAGKVCQSGKCVTGSAPTCTQDSECTSPRRCYGGRCVSLPAGFEFPAPREVVAEKTPEKEPDPREVPPTDQEVTPETQEPPPGDQDAGPPEQGEPVPENPTQTICKSDKDCAKNPGEVCAPHSKDAMSCQPALATGQSLSGTCDPSAAAPGECKSLICHPGKYCTTPCVDDKDCPGGQGTCVETTLASGGKFKLCNDQGDGQCLHDAHCGSGFQCIVREARANQASTQCGTGVGGGQVGTACFGHSECSNNVCINRQFCSKPCLTDTDCSAPYVCGATEIEFPINSGNKYTLQLCQVPPAGLPCKLTSDCLLRGNQCSPKDIAGALELRCQAPAGTTKFGEACSKDADCESNYCLTDGTCTQACDQDADCPAAGGASIKCLALDLTRGAASGKLKACAILRQGCTKDSDCSASEACAPFTDASGIPAMKCITRFANSGKANSETCAANADCQSRYCTSAACAACTKDTDCDSGSVCVSGTCSSSKPLGADCAKADDCLSRVCFQKLCSLACAANTDCNKTGYGCTSETITESGKTFMGQLCTIPQGGLPCFTSADCPSAQTKECAIVEVGGTPVTRCRAKVGAKANGEACTADADCQSGNCLQPDGTCTQSCTQDSDCTTKQRCAERDFTPSGGGNAVQIKVCGQIPCSGDADCDTGQICVYKPATGGAILRCETPNAAKKALGVICTADLDCQSGLCSTGSTKLCAAVCQGGKSESCPLQFTCEATATGTGSTHLCTPIADTCTKSSDCLSTQRCVLTFDANQRPVRTCQTPVGKGKLGDICDPKAKPSQCETGHCDTRTNRCTEFCDSNTDCPTGGLYTCSTATFPKAQGQAGPAWMLQYCRSLECDYDGSCEAAETCQASIVQSKVAKRCVVSTSKKAGDPCSAHSDCASGLCQFAKCSALCAAHRHCPATDRCADAQIVPSLSTNGCTPGTRSACASDDDCVTGTVCQANFNSSGDAITECKTPKATDKAAGLACTPGSFPGECASHLCDSVTQRCLKTCDPNLPQLNDCAPGTEVCGNFPLLTKAVNACLPPPAPCQKASDCPSGTSCAATIEQGKAAYICARPSGSQPKKVGDTCDPGKAHPGECETQLCHPVLKVCVNTCTADTDCATARPKCGQIEIASGVFAQACTTSNVTCDTNANCSASEPVCALELSTQLTKRCSSGGPGTKKTGEACDPTKNIPGDCISRFCEEGTNTCVDTCDKDSHCPQGLVCATTFVEQTRQAKACVKPVDAPCTHQTDCPRPYACVSNRETTQITSKCQTPAGSDPGSACTPAEVTANSGNYKLDSACKSNICHPDTQICTTPCRNDADCTLGKCKGSQLEGFQVNVCDASCDKDADCGAGQVCGAELEASGDVRPLCIIPKIGNKAKGATCDPAKARYDECQSGVCGPSTSTCLALCSQDSDCGGGEICDITFARTALTTQKPIKACVPAAGSCTKPAHCISGFLCGAQARGTGAVVSCFNTSTADNEGTTCATKPLPGDCTTGLCDPKSLECTTACDVTADCTNGTRSTCGTITVMGSALKACVQP